MSIPQSFLRHSFPVMLFALLAFTACKKDPDAVAELLTATEAAELTEAAVSSRSAGVTAPTASMADLLSELLDNCGVPGDTTISKSISVGPATGNATWTLDYLVNCTSLGVPTDAVMNLDGAGAFSSGHWSGTAASAGTLTFTGLQPSAPAYLASGTLSVDGVVTGDLRRTDPTLNVTVALSLTNLAFDKTNSAITGGTGTVLLTAASASGQSQTLNGTLVFSGNNTATVTLNGHSHTFSW